MNTRYTTVNLDVSQQGSIPSITLSQYDLGVGLGFYIMDGGLPYSEFAETDTVVLSGTKPSGVGFTVPAYYKSGNLCSFRTPQAMTTEAGTVTCEITITKVNNISVSTANFFVEVEASAHAHETVDEDIEDFSLIANQVGEYKAVAVRAAQQAAQSATDAAASASSAEESMEAAQSAASSAIAAKDDIQEYIDDSEAWARGTRGGTAVPSTDETYENNAKYYAEQSSQASMDAGVSATEAAASAQEAAASVVGAVKYTAQSLTTEQKAQARTNIGAASPSDIPSGTVRYDTSQSLTDAQKTQALVNIGGAFAGSVAGEFNTFTAYAVGDTVIYQSKLYEFTSAHAAGAWNASHVTAISVMDEVSDLKGDLSEIEPGLSDVAKEALLNCLSHLVWLDKNGQSYYNALETALYVIKSYGYPKNLLLLQGTPGFLFGSQIDGIRYRNEASNKRNRRMIATNDGIKAMVPDVAIENEVYPIKVPYKASSAYVSVSPSSMGVLVQLWKYDVAEDVYKLLLTPYWSEGNQRIEFDESDSMYIAINIRADSSNSDFTVEPSSVSLAFSQSKYPKLSVDFEPGTTKIYDDYTLNDLKDMLTVKYYRAFNDYDVITNYNLTGSLSTSVSTITVSYGGLYKTFDVNVIVGRPLSASDVVSYVGYQGFSVDSDGNVISSGTASFSIMELNQNIKHIRFTPLKTNDERTDIPYWTAFYKVNADRFYVNGPTQIFVFDKNENKYDATRNDMLATITLNSADLFSPTGRKDIVLKDDSLIITEAYDQNVGLTVTEANVIGIWSDVSQNQRPQNVRVYEN